MPPSSPPKKHVAPSGVGPNQASPAAGPSTGPTGRHDAISFKRKRALITEDEIRHNLIQDEKELLKDGFPLDPPPYVPYGRPSHPLSDMIALSNEIVTTTTAALRQSAILRSALNEETYARNRYDYARDTVISEAARYDALALRRSLAWQRYREALADPGVPPDRDGISPTSFQDDDDQCASSTHTAEDGDAGEPVDTRESSIIEIFP